MTREEADFIGGMNMCDEISNEAYRKIMCHCEENEATWMIEPNETDFYKCSACGFGALVSFPHCPGCGKRMKKFWEE